MLWKYNKNVVSLILPIKKENYAGFDKFYIWGKATNTDFLTKKSHPSFLFLILIFLCSGRRPVVPMWDERECVKFLMK